MEIKDRTSTSDIKKLLFVLGSAIATAFLLAAFMIYTYGPTGRYLVKNILLSPKTLQTLKYEDNTGHDRLVFSDVVFSYYDKGQKLFRQVNLSPDQYLSLYALIEDDESLENENEDLFRLFNEEKLTKLAIRVKLEKKDKPELRQFQVVEFSLNGSHYRIQLREDQNQSSFAYFYHEGILKQITESILETL